MGGGEVVRSAFVAGGSRSGLFLFRRACGASVRSVLPFVTVASPARFEMLIVVGALCYHLRSKQSCGGCR